jgi:hypothetical protein
MGLLASMNTNTESNQATPVKQNSGAIKVEIIKVDGQYQLLRGGQPYEVRGAGLASTDLESVKLFGGNSIRTWTVDSHAEPAQQLLDRAHAMGITVSLCLEFNKERHGFDFNDKVALAKQLAENSARVERYKNHPALLTWFIGNEVNLGFNDPKVFDAVNETAKMIKEIDPNHPVTTPLAGFDTKAMDAIKERAPDLDFVSFQLYGDVVNLPKYVADYGYEGPYFVSEWGSIGHWEVKQTEWGAPIESTSSQKADNFLQSYHKALAPYADQTIGNYVFLWGQKQEKTPTWYGMFLSSGEKTEAVDVMHHIWSGEWPQNRAPRISSILIDAKSAMESVTLVAGQPYRAEVQTSDAEGDTIRYYWEVRAESKSNKIGGDAEYLPELFPGLISQQNAKTELTAPAHAGAYRLFVYAYDGHNNAAHANIPFMVQQQGAKL